MKKRILSILLCLVMLLGLIPAAALAEAVPTQISSIAATITAPAIGETPAATATLTPADGLTCGTVYWFKLSDSKNPETASAEDWSKMAAGETFDEEHYYKVNISAAKAGSFTFADSVSGSVNEKSCTVTDMFGMAKVLTYVFEPLEAPKPEYPDLDDITNLDNIKIGMLCSQDPQGHSKFYGLLDGGTTSSGQAEKKDGVYQFTLTINPAIYLAQYNKDTGIKHEFVKEPDSLSIVVKYDSEKMEWSAVPNNEDMVQLGLFVKCEAPAPAYPDLDDITNLDKIQIGMLCSQDPQGHSKFYGLLDGGTTSSGQAEKKDGVYQFTLTINPAIYLAQYNKDTGIKHEFVTAPEKIDLDSLSIVVKYDSEKKEWSAVPNKGNMVELGLFVKCDEHVVEYTVSFDKNGGTGTMDSVMVEEGAEYTLPECKFTAPAGKVFKAWSVNGTEKSVGDKITVNADTTVTAVWKVKLTPYVPGHTHSYTKAVTAPTCTDKGYTTYTCSCGNSYVSDYVNANGHTEVVDAAVAATCEKTGLTEGKHCSVCNAVLTAQKETPKAAHSFDKGFCSVCGAVDASYVPFKDVKEGDAFYDDIMWAWKNHIIVGDENGNYNADDDLTRAQVVTMLWRMSGSPKAEKAAGFSDLTQDWYKEAVAWAVEKGIVKGIGNNLFDPDGTCTRAMFVTMLWRLNGFETAENAAPFTDLTQDWYKAAVAWASSNGVTKGTSSTTFSPDDNCTRGQAAAFLHRLAQLEK